MLSGERALAGRTVPPPSFVPVSKPQHGSASPTAPSLACGTRRVPSADTHSHGQSSGAVLPQREKLFCCCCCLFFFVIFLWFFFFFPCCHSNHIPPPQWAAGAGWAAREPVGAMGRMRPRAEEGSCWLPITSVGSSGRGARAGRCQGTPSAEMSLRWLHLPFLLPAVRGSPKAADTAKLRLYQRILVAFRCFGSLQRELGYFLICS